MLLLSSSVDSLRTKVGSFWASQSATLLSDAIMAACSVLRSLLPAPPLPAPLFLERDLWWSGVNFDTWSLMVTFPGEVLSNSMVKEAWPWAVKQMLQFYCVSQRQSVNTVCFTVCCYQYGHHTKCIAHLWLRERRCLLCPWWESRGCRYWPCDPPW